MECYGLNMKYFSPVQVLNSWSLSGGAILRGLETLGDRAQLQKVGY
jgi:hypothetical protein